MEKMSRQEYDEMERTYDEWVRCACPYDRLRSPLKAERWANEAWFTYERKKWRPVTKPVTEFDGSISERLAGFQSENGMIVESPSFYYRERPMTSAQARAAARLAAVIGQLGALKDKERRLKMRATTLVRLPSRSYYRDARRSAGRLER